MNIKKTVAVIFGGRSVERRISINTAFDVIATIERLGYIAYPVFLSPQGTFWMGDALSNPSTYSDKNWDDDIGKKANLAFFLRDHNNLFIYNTNSNGEQKEDKIDVVFLAVHGKDAEDGTLAGFFNALNVPFTGTSVCTSAICMNKYYAKCVLDNNKITILPGKFISKDFSAQDRAIILNEIIEMIGFPLLTKPVDSGSSVGVMGKIESREHLNKGIEHAFQYSSGVLIEKYLSDRTEVSVAVFNDGNKMIISDYHISKVPEGHIIITSEDKYEIIGEKPKTDLFEPKISREVYHKIPSADRNNPIIDPLSAKIEETAKKIYNVLSCSGLVRIDFFVSNSVLYFNEINSIPGSFCTDCWETVEFNYIIEKMIEMASQNQQKRQIPTPLYVRIHGS